MENEVNNLNLDVKKIADAIIYEYEFEDPKPLMEDMCSIELQHKLYLMYLYFYTTKNVLLFDTDMFKISPTGPFIQELQDYFKQFNLEDKESLKDSKSIFGPELVKIFDQFMLISKKLKPWEWNKLIYEDFKFNERYEEDVEKYVDLDMVKNDASIFYNFLLSYYSDLLNLPVNITTENELIEYLDKYLDYLKDTNFTDLIYNREVFKNIFIGLYNVAISVECRFNALDRFDIVKYLLGKENILNKILTALFTAFGNISSCKDAVTKLLYNEYGSYDEEKGYQTIYPNKNPVYFKYIESINAIEKICKTIANEEFNKKYNIKK